MREYLNLSSVNARVCARRVYTNARAYLNTRTSCVNVSGNFTPTDQVSSVCSGEGISAGQASNTSGISGNRAHVKQACLNLPSIGASKDQLTQYPKTPSAVAQATRYQASVPCGPASSECLPTDRASSRLALAD